MMTAAADDQPSILLVDDSPLTLACAADALMAAGFRVQTAPDLAALDVIATGQRFDLVLMDVVMPEVFGDDVAAMLRTARRIDAPILLLSSLDEHELVERVLDAGLDGHIPKSAGVDGMVERVLRFLEDRVGGARVGRAT